MKLEAAQRLIHALSAEDEMPLDAIVDILAKQGIDSEYPDDNKNSIVAFAGGHQVLMTLALAKWRATERNEVAGGLYSSGSCTYLKGPTSLRMYDTSPSRVTLWAD